ncbi:sigma factor-like helix-turn-helix DNA-binding protein [Mycoplasma buteonis]|uniref:sigma factor-like helix-turn-helix DNA-binding protein n=1 Tax=Mycoplasma buteonis TaxID=171280 RepID=UPI00055DA24B|nr:sigma factor-like helix-turn-helix DNA-binding protein [Mycoplasma buteonis]
MNKKDIQNVEKYTFLFEKYSNFLTQNQKQVFQLFYFEDLSYSEIAEILATSRTAAYDTLKKATQKLEKVASKVDNSLH